MSSAISVLYVLVVVEDLALLIVSAMHLAFCTVISAQILLSGDDALRHQGVLVIGVVARLPLDAAAGVEHGDALVLDVVERRVEPVSQVRARDGRRRPSAAAVVLTVIHEVCSLEKMKESVQAASWPARSPGWGRRYGNSYLPSKDLSLHALGAVLRKLLGSLLLMAMTLARESLPGEICERAPDVLDIGAVRRQNPIGGRFGAARPGQGRAIEVHRLQRGGGVPGLTTTNSGHNKNAELTHVTARPLHDALAATVFSGMWTSVVPFL